MFDPRTPATFDASTAFGLGTENVFASEFGCAAMSSFESMSATLDAQHWSLHGNEPEDDCRQTDVTNTFWRDCTGTNPMAERNYPCDPIIFSYFGNMSLDAWGPLPFQRQLYLCMLGQALEMQADIESRRATNQFGLLIWQLNEIWPTGGWGSIEYGTPVPGQVLGGRWKPLQHFFEASLYADTIATCGANGTCYVVCASHKEEEDKRKGRRKREEMGADTNFFGAI